MEEYKIISILFTGHEIVMNDSNLFNVRDLEGNLLSPDLWFDSISEKFIEDFIIVKKYNKYNFLSIEGELLLDKWCYDCFPFFNGKSIIFPEVGTVNVVTSSGELLYEDSYLEFGEPRMTDFLIRSGDHYNLLSEEGNNLFPDVKITDYITDQTNTVIFLKDTDWKCYLPETKTLLDYTFKDVVPQEIQLFKVQLADGTYNFIDFEGNFIYQDNFKYCYDFRENISVIIKENGLENYLTYKGEILIPYMDFSVCEDFSNGSSKATDTEGNSYKVTKQGDLIPL